MRKHMQTGPRACVNAHRHSRWQIMQTTHKTADRKCGQQPPMATETHAHKAEDNDQCRSAGKFRCSSTAASDTAWNRAAHVQARTGERSTHDIACGVSHLRRHRVALMQQRRMEPNAWAANDNWKSKQGVHRETTQ